jgi:hypothetical protein
MRCATHFEGAAVDHRPAKHARVEHVGGGEKARAQASIEPAWVQIRSSGSIDRRLIFASNGHMSGPLMIRRALMGLLGMPAYGHAHIFRVRVSQCF